MNWIWYVGHKCTRKLLSQNFSESLSKVCVNLWMPEHRPRRRQGHVKAHLPFQGCAILQHSTAANLKFGKYRLLVDNKNKSPLYNKKLNGNPVTILQENIMQNSLTIPPKVWNCRGIIFFSTVIVFTLVFTCVATLCCCNTSLSRIVACCHTLSHIVTRVKGEQHRNT